jgi:hypothetical protein
MLVQYASVYESYIIERKHALLPPQCRLLLMNDTTAVELTVTAIEPAAAAGRLLGVANVELVIVDVSLTLQGIQIRRDARDGMVVVAPQFRHPRNGRWLPSVLLPRELKDAIAHEVIAAYATVVEATQPISLSRRPQ